MDTTVAASTSPAVSNSNSTQPATVFTLTERAVGQIKEVMKSQNLADHFLTVRVVPAGCSGLGYDLNLVKEKKDGDMTWEQEGIVIVTDALSVQYLQGTVVDYVKTDMAAGFKFENPNAKSSCGCGSSFSA